MSTELTPEAVCGFLNEFCEHDRPILPETELLESGLLDSLAFIELLNALEDIGFTLQTTRIPRERFACAASIAELCREDQALAGFSQKL